MPQYFDPMSAHTYTVDEIINFLKDDSRSAPLTLQEINTFRPAAGFSHNDLIKMLKAQACTMRDLQSCGVSLDRTFSTDDFVDLYMEGICSTSELHDCGVSDDKIQRINERIFIIDMQRSEWESVRKSNNRDELEKYIINNTQSPFCNNARNLLEELTDEADWMEARKRRTLGAYAYYMTEHPEGKHKQDAINYIHKIETEGTEIEQQLIEDMKASPWKYSSAQMSALMEGKATDPNAPRPENDEEQSPSDRFLARGLKLEFSTLVNNGVVPENFTRLLIESPDFDLPQTANFDNFPLDRTDVYFLGMPRSGKSTVLATLFYTMYREGRWQHRINLNPHTHIDPTLDYYNGLLKSVVAKKPPVSTGTDTISYISMDVPAGEKKDKTAHINFVEISGEAVKMLAARIMPGGNTQGVWQDLGASRVLSNCNSKVLFFLLDYSKIASEEAAMDVLEQELTLKTILQVLTNDGTGKNNRKGCTMSRVESVAILLTKADLMNTDDNDERQRIAMNYLENNFTGFMQDLTNCCAANNFDINHNNGNKPLVFTFSAGKFYVGNTMAFDNTDALRLAERIEALAPY